MRFRRSTNQYTVVYIVFSFPVPISAGKNQLLLNCDSGLNSECVADVVGVQHMDILCIIIVDSVYPLMQALGVLATYVKLPGPTSGDFLRIYNRLVESHHDLMAKKQLNQPQHSSPQPEIQSD